MAPPRKNNNNKSKPESSIGKKQKNGKLPMNKRRIQPICEICKDILSAKAYRERRYNGVESVVCDTCCVMVKHVTGGVRLKTSSNSEKEQICLLRRALFLFAQDPHHAYYIAYSHPRRCIYYQTYLTKGLNQAATELASNFCDSDDCNEVFHKAGMLAITDLVQLVELTPVEEEKYDWEKEPSNYEWREKEGDEKEEEKKEEDDDEEEEEEEKDEAEPSTE